MAEYCMHPEYTELSDIQPPAEADYLEPIAIQPPAEADYLEPIAIQPLAEADYLEPIAIPSRAEKPGSGIQASLVQSNSEARRARKERIALMVPVYIIVLVILFYHIGTTQWTTCQPTSTGQPRPAGVPDETSVTESDAETGADESSGVESEGTTSVMRPETETVDYCATNPCKNGGTCVSGASDYTCACPSLWTGVTCECSLSDTFPGREETVKVSSQTGEYSNVDVNVFVETDDNAREWIVLMRRHDASVDFVNRDWTEYKGGFGHLFSEFWLGNDNMHHLTHNGSSWTARVDLQSVGGECRHAEYRRFSVGSEAQNYRLTIEGYSRTSTLGDKMAYHNGQMFSTTDRDNDGCGCNCAARQGGGWWYKDCSYAKLTGTYGVLGVRGIYWIDWPVVFKQASLKIRAV